MLVIYNATIPHLFTSQPDTSALVIDRGVILAVGNDEEIRSTYSKAKPFDANKLTLIPGLTDAHIHLESYALSLQKIDCETQTQTECLQRVAERAINAQPGEWIFGHGWNQNNWPQGYGTAQQLDDIAPNNPVYLTHKSLHCAWANSAALHLAGIKRNTIDPADGVIGRSEDGEPDGILYESAMELLESSIPEPRLEQVTDSLQSTQPILWKMGITGAHDFDGKRCFSALQILNRDKQLKLRIQKGIPFENLKDAINLGMRSGFGDDMLRIGSLKLFSDGALGPHTAAMLLPYEDDPRNTGILMLDAESLVEIGQQAVSNGISIAVHAIGDRANHEILNGYAQLRRIENANPSVKGSSLRHRIEHVQVLHPDDIKRFSELNIIASMQPIHATSDMLMADQFWGKRSAYAYAWREQIKTGATLIFGSDAPVESPNPFWGIYAAVTRRREDGSPSELGWYPEQRLNVSEAICAYTTGPAFAAGLENKLGRLIPGFLADLVVLSQDPFTCNPDDIRNIRSLATMIGGDWVFSEL